MLDRSGSESHDEDMVTKKRPTDVNQLAKMLVDMVTGPHEEPEKNPHAVALGRMGGLKGGPARAAALTAAKRSVIAKKAAKKRWATKGNPVKVKKGTSKK